jgi:serine/threonine-protein kinase
MAEVFVAESAGIEGFKKTVAIKRVLPHLSEKKRFIAMFLDEARLSAHLNHSNVVQVFDIGVGDNTYFIVMEYVDGADLKQVINHVREQGRPFPIEQAVYICVKMCEGLAYAHETTNESGELLHVVHRDISPPNVLISKHGEIKIVDFGLAKASTQLEKSEAGIIKGKFSYLAPEAAHGQEVDARADIFAVGIILWEMLAGRRLFQGTSDYETVKQVQGASVPPISRVSPEADAHLERILARTLARDREKRYGSARSLGRDLSRYLYQLGKPVSAFDIAELVHGPITARERKKRETEGTSIIDKLIQETLFQFTSLQDKDASVTSEVSDAPFSFEDFAGYADDGSEGQRKSHIDIPDLGNLASLEDDEMRGSSSDLDVHAVRDSLADLEDGPASGDLRASLPGAADQRASMASMPQHSVAPPPKPSTAALKALLLIVIAAGTAAAVWFSGLL